MSDSMQPDPHWTEIALPVAFALGCMIVACIVIVLVR